MKIFFKFYFFFNALFQVSFTIYLLTCHHTGQTLSSKLYSLLTLIGMLRNFYYVFYVVTHHLFSHLAINELIRNMEIAIYHSPCWHLGVRATNTIQENKVTSIIIQIVGRRENALSLLLEGYGNNQNKKRGGPTLGQCSKRWKGGENNEEPAVRASLFWKHGGPSNN